MDPRERLELARRACWKWRYDRDFDDIVSEAVIRTLDCDGPPAYLFRRMRWRAVEHLRRRSGRNFERDHWTLQDWEVPSHEDRERVELVVTEVEERVVRLLAEGLTKRQVAERLGVHPSRVSQHLAAIRRRNDRLLHRET